MDREVVRNRLGEERERLEGLREQYSNLADESESDGMGEVSSYDQHQADLATETFERERDLTVLDQVEAELADVEHALQRLDEGTYGLCEACGKPIGDDRLEALPATRFCLDDQAKAEREAHASPERP